MGGGDRDIREARRGQAGLVLAERQGAGDAAHVGPPLGPLVRTQVVVGDDVADPDSAACPEDPGHLPEDRRLVGSQVDHAVADDNVDRLSRQRDRLDLALEELDVGRAGFGRVAPSQGQHLVGHVQAERSTGRPDPAGGQEHVDPAAGAKVQDPVARAQVGHRRGIAATERGQHGRVRQPVALELAVQLGADPGFVVAASRAVGQDLDGGLRVALPDGFVDLLGHRSAPRGRWTERRRCIDT